MLNQRGFRPAILRVRVDIEGHQDRAMPELIAQGFGLDACEPPPGCVGVSQVVPRYNRYVGAESRRFQVSC